MAFLPRIRARPAGEIDRSQRLKTSHLLSVVMNLGVSLRVPVAITVLRIAVVSSPSAFFSRPFHSKGDTGGVIMQSGRDESGWDTLRCREQGAGSREQALASPSLCIYGPFHFIRLLQLIWFTHASLLHAKTATTAYVVC